MGWHTRDFNHSPSIPTLLPVLPQIQLMAVNDRQPFLPPLHRNLFDVPLLSLHLLSFGLLQ